MCALTHQPAFQGLASVSSFPNTLGRSPDFEVSLKHLRIECCTGLPPLLSCDCDHQQARPRLYFIPPPRRYFILFLKFYLYTQHLAQCLVHSRGSVNTYWKNAFLLTNAWRVNSMCTLLFWLFGQHLRNGQSWFDNWTEEGLMQQPEDLTLNLSIFLPISFSLYIDRFCRGFSWSVFRLPECGRGTFVYPYHYHGGKRV